MNVSSSSGVYSNYVMQAVAASAAASPPTDTGRIPAALTASLLAPVSGTMLPRVQLPADQLAMLQSGAGLKAPDPAKTAAQNSTRASALVRDAKTGQILAGVWPNVASISAVTDPIIADDQRLTSDRNPADEARFLAQDIQQATGRDVTVQYFQPGDPNAPTFGTNGVLGSYATF